MRPLSLWVSASSAILLTSSCVRTSHPKPLGFVALMFLTNSGTGFPSLW
ncbi:MAG: hypothetical protein QW788_01795 [Candidatus Hadarchaeales archaeon]